MLFDDMLTDDVYIVNTNGQKSGPYKTRFGTDNKLQLFDDKLEIDIDEGYQLIRPLPNGKDMVYTVTDYNFQERFHDIPPQHILKLVKGDKPPKPKAPSQKTVVNIHNSQGFQVGDNNVQNITNSFNELVERINSSDSNEDEKKEAKGLLKSLLENPTVSAILGSATSGLLSLLG